MHAGFKYRKSMVLAKNVKLPERTSGCGCKGKCTDFSACACGKLDGKDFPYVSSNGG
ncbi:hypothetical protein MKW94_017788, partial [Papaver nudicaule]|nr:hypothetical protein [Papaver nudicaule]